MTALYGMYTKELNTCLTTSYCDMSEASLSLSRQCRSELESKCTCFDLTASER